MSKDIKNPSFCKITKAADVKLTEMTSAGG